MLSSGYLATNDAGLPAAYATAGTPVQALPAMNALGKSFLLRNGGQAMAEFSMDGQVTWMPLFWGGGTWLLDGWDGSQPLWIRREKGERANVQNVFAFQISEADARSIRSKLGMIFNRGN